MPSESGDYTTNGDALDLDWEHLHQLSEDNTEFEMELLQMFVEDLPEHLEAVKVAIANNDFESIKHEGHYIKGSSANVGATAMRNSAEKLEEMAKHEQLEGANDVLSDLSEYVNRIQAFLAANA
jgi:HPt (histidine-containing phosphotransfer) domain-containing protein